jgi:hypothetical protein
VASLSTPGSEIRDAKAKDSPVSFGTCKILPPYMRLSSKVAEVLPVL